jgi:hypothetical protein
VKVLIACEYSGIVRSAFKKKGHDAWSCDILPTEIQGNHIQDDVLKHLDKGWDLMIAHPPCTYLTNAASHILWRGKKLNIDRFKKGQIAAKFFKKLYDANIPQIVIENPIPSKAFGLPKYNQIINPNQFGHKVSKRTCLWLKNVEKLKATEIVKDYVVFEYYNPPEMNSKNRGKIRSQFWSGIAEAMAEQWS